MDAEEHSKTHSRIPQRINAIIVILLIHLTPNYGDMFCPPAVLDAGYTIAAENYHINTSDTNNLLITWYFGLQTFAVCNLTTRQCVQDKDFADINDTYVVHSFGVDSMQLNIEIESFAKSMEGNYSIRWERVGYGVELYDTCQVAEGNPVDECIEQNPCVNSTQCRDLLSGYFCNCTSGYGGMNCKEGDMKLYCSTDSYGVRFTQPGDGCGNIPIDCYIAGLDFQTDVEITSRQITTSSSSIPSAVATVLNKTVSFRVCITSNISAGTYQILFELQSYKAVASLNFEIMVLIEDVNHPPVFNTPEIGAPYVINIIESTPTGSIIVQVNKSTTQTCLGGNGCIQVIDWDFNQTKGIDSLSLHVIENFTTTQTAPISFQNSTARDSLGYFYVSRELTPGTSFSYLMTVTDGEQGSGYATVIFKIVDVNHPPDCNQDTINATLNISTQPPIIVGAVVCTDRDVNELFRKITYSVEGQYSGYFIVDANGTIFMNRSLLDLEPGLLNFTVRATGISDTPDESYHSDIPVSINLTVPEPKCNLTITSAPQMWRINSTAELKLECDIRGVDKLKIASWNYKDVFDVQYIKESSTVYRVALTVVQYNPAEYNFEITATLGGSGAAASVFVQMYNPPQFLPLNYETTVTDTMPVGATVYIVQATTDIPSATVSITLKIGDPDSLFEIYGGVVFLAKPVRNYANRTFHIVFEAQDSVSHLTSNHIWNVTIVDTNELPSCDPLESVTVNSSLLPGSFITSITCHDPDVTPEFRDLIYSISAEPPSVLLGITSSGSITLLEILPPGVTSVTVLVNVSDIFFSTFVTFNIEVVVIKCPSENTTTEYQLHFPETPVNSMAVVNCSSIYTGQVYRFCNLNQTWGLFNFTNCRRKDLQNATYLINQLKTNPSMYSDSEVTTTIMDISSQLTRSLADSPIILSGDIKQMVGIISDVGELTQLYKNVTLDRETVENFVECSDDLMGVAVQKWIDALHEEDEEGALLLSAMDTITNASLRFEELGIEDPIVKANIVVKRGSTSEDIFFPDRGELMYQKYGGWVLQTNSSVSLSKEAFLRGKERIKYAVILYHNATDKLRINSKLQNDVSLMGKVLNSDILSLTISEEIPFLSPPLVLRFSVIQNNYSNSSCGYLNILASVPGLWASEGCEATEKGGIIQCSCNHLTNFAVLMSPYGFVPSDDSRILSIISAVGCGISIFCLFITILIYMVLWKYIKCDRLVLHLNLSVVLIMAYVIFLAGVDDTDSVVGCKVIAALLHYIYLVVFFLMLSEGIEIFKSVSFVFSTKSILLKLILVSYGVPLVIVGVSLGVTKTEGYGSKTSCWLSTKDGLIWAFVGPVLLILLINFIILLQVLRIMLNSRHLTDKTTVEKTKSIVRTACILSPLLGLTWVFGVLSVNEDTVVFQYLFAIFNSLQGLMIFICYCIMAHQVRDGFKAMRRKYRARSYDSGAGSRANPPLQRSSDSGENQRRFCDLPRYQIESSNLKKENRYENSEGLTYSTVKTNTSRSTRTTQFDSADDGGQYSSYGGSHERSVAGSTSSRDWWRDDVPSQQPSPGYEHSMPLAFTDSGRGVNGPYAVLSTSYTSYSDNVLNPTTGHTNYGYHDDLFDDAHENSMPISSIHRREAAFRPEQNLTPQQNRARENWKRIEQVARPSGAPVSHNVRQGGDRRFLGSKPEWSSADDL